MRYTLGIEAGPDLGRPTTGLYCIMDGDWVTDAYCTIDAINNISYVCEIHGGIFYGGDFISGSYYGGDYYGGTFLAGTYHRGVYFGGSFYSAGARSHATYYGGVYSSRASENKRKWHTGGRSYYG